MSKRSIKQVAHLSSRLPPTPDPNWFQIFCGEGNNGLNFLNEKLKMKQKFCCSKLCLPTRSETTTTTTTWRWRRRRRDTDGHAWRRYKQKRFLKEPLVGTARGALKKFNQQNVTAVAAFSLLGSLSRRSVGSGCRLVVHFSRPFPTHMLGNAWNARSLTAVWSFNKCISVMFTSLAKLRLLLLYTVLSLLTHITHTLVGTNIQMKYTTTLVCCGGCSKSRNLPSSNPSLSLSTLLCCIL